MATYRSFNDLVLSFIEYLRLVQPDLDTKPGTVARDLFVDAPSQQLAEFYSQLRNVSGLQSLFSVRGTDLIRLASNFGVTKTNGTSSSGVATFTTNNLDIDVVIPNGSIAVANNGVSFSIIGNFVMSTVNANVYRATATRLRTELDLASITDQFAIEIPSEATSTGSDTNIGIYSLSSHSVAGIANVTNLTSFTGGANTESDDEFIARILSVFSGSNTGTKLGYLSSVDTVSGVNDSILIASGNPLMDRDGTQIITNSSGELAVSESGTGGKVDIYVFGSDLNSSIDTIIYSDKSGKRDPTDPDNDIVLGQRGLDPTVNISQRRVELIANNTLPFQPADSIISVVGSLSGQNFVEKFTDTDGQIKGNYELIKDTGSFGGSSFGFDKLRWISDKIELDLENSTKGTFNGVDSLEFSGIDEIRGITQDILVIDENSVSNSSDRSLIILKHSPVISVSRVFNVTTGERYTVEDQNPDGITGELNTTRNIKISGSTLPVSTDILQVNYIWVKSFDKDIDFDNLQVTNVNRTTQDSVDWSFSNLVSEEPAVIADGDNGDLIITLTHPIFKIISTSAFSTSIASISDGAIPASESVTNVIDIRRISDNAELFNTDLSDGSLSGSSRIILPSDTIGIDGDSSTIRFNATNVFDPDGYDAGSFDGNVITLSSGLFPTGTTVLVSYIANVSSVIPETDMENFPAIKNDNVFTIGDENIGNQPTSNIITSDTITDNLRLAGSNLRIVIGASASEGSILVSGTSVKRISNTLVTITGSGLKIDLKPVILSDLGVSNLPSTVYVSRVISVEGVSIDNSGIVTSIDNTYDIINYKLNNNTYDIKNALSDSTLNVTSIELPSTTNNTLVDFDAGDIVKVTFYYQTVGVSELVNFSKDGEQITDKSYSSISRVSVGNGFKDATGSVIGNVTISNFNQPVNNTSYIVNYNYTAPKENERITVTFNNNALINTVTTSIESVRPVTSDVLIKEAKKKIIEVDVRIVILSEFADQTQTVIQDVTDSISSFLTSESLGSTIDASDVNNNIYSVQGVDRVRIFNFSVESGGNVPSIRAEQNEYLVAGTINVLEETR